MAHADAAIASPGELVFYEPFTCNVLSKQSFALNVAVASSR